MIFNSYLFWAFFALVYAIYCVLPYRRQNVLLLLASYVFYGAWDWRFLSLIWISTALDYFVALVVHSKSDIRLRKALVSLSVVINLGFLAVFKYYDFFASELVGLLAEMNIPVSLSMINIALPVGISFYTFQTMSYTIDVYRHKCEPAEHFVDFALYVCFFPQLVAGPIERYAHLMPQFQKPRCIQGSDLSEGFYHILIGLFKKVVIADNMATFVDVVFDAPLSQLSGFECLLGVYAFAFQIYCDFSGYSSIAQGVAKFMGFDLMYNFHMPYFAVSPSDFWHRWHISLSTWLRDYLYIPLGGNRKGAFRTYLNLVVTMVLGGLWHGAGWTYLAWGLFHGLLLCAYRPFERKLQSSSSPNSNKVVHGLLVVLMFHLVCIGWLLFRANSIGQAYDMFRLMLTDASWFDIPYSPERFAMAWTGLGELAFFAGPLILLELWTETKKNMLQLLSVYWFIRATVYAYFLLMLLFFPPVIEHVFIYFQF